MKQLINVAYKNNLRLFIVAFIVVAAVASIGLSLKANAANQELTITPTSVSISVKPGETYTDKLEVINQGSEALNYKVYSTPYSVSGEEYDPDFSPIDNAVNPSSWINLPAETGKVAAGKVGDINYKVTVPSDAKAGGYYASLFIESTSQEVVNGVNISKRVGEIFYIKVEGDVKEQGSLLGWNTSFLQQKPFTARVRFENTGTVHYPAEINLQVSDVFGNTKYSFNTTKEILPQTIRKITISWDHTPYFGLFKVTGNVSYLGNQTKLPTRWVLIMSPLVRFIILAILLTAVAYSLRKHLMNHDTKLKKSKPVTKKPETKLE